jgi:hypothetical protein
MTRFRINAREQMTVLHGANSSKNLRWSSSVKKKNQTKKQESLTTATLQALRAIQQVKSENKDKKGYSKRIGGIYGRILDLNFQTNAKVNQELLEIKRTQQMILDLVKSQKSGGSAQLVTPPPLVTTPPLPPSLPPVFSPRPHLDPDEKCTALQYSF